MKRTTLNISGFILFVLFSYTLTAQQQIIVDPAGQGDHTTLKQALESVNGTTLTSDVEILMKSGVYTEEGLKISQIDNAQNDHSIVIRSESENAEDVIIRNSDTTSFNPRLFTISHVNNLVIEHITIEANGKVYTENLISLGNGLENIRFENNVFANPYTNAAYAFQDFYDFNEDADTITNLVINNNRFAETITFINYYHHYLNLTFKNNVIEDLEYDNSGSTSNWSNISGLTISGNEFQGLGMGVFTNCKDVVLHSNYINSEDVGLTLSANYDEGHSTYRIYNNFVLSEDFGVQVLFAGLKVEIANNNFFTRGNGSGAAIALNTYTVSEIYNKVSVLNNNFYGERSGDHGVIMYRNPDSLVVDTIQFDHNNYFSPGDITSWRILDQQYIDLSLSELQTTYGLETNGLSIDPIYQSETDLHIGNAGLQNQGIPIDYITVDYDGETREGDPDIGADELRGFVNLAPVNTLSVTGNLSGGKNIQVRYQVENQGNLRLNGDWRDAIYLSPDQTLDATDRLLAEEQRSFLLETGDTYTGDLSISLPIDIPGGNYYILLKVNDGEKEFDKDLTDNTLASDVLDFQDPVFPDLQVTEVITPPTQFSGKSFELEWTVTNTGNGPTTDTWQDYVYVANQAEALGDPSIVGSDSLFLRRVTAPVALNPGESYQQTLRVNIPLRYSGKLFYRIQSNALENLTELDGSFADNGHTSEVVNITQSPLPDLAVTQLSTPATAFSGDKVPVNWTVENVGQQTTYRTSVQLDQRDWFKRSNYNYWYDNVYISKMPYFDPDEPTQRIVARYDRGTEELDAAASYTVEDSIAFDPCEYGWYYVFVQTNDDLYTYELTYQNNINIIDSIELVIDPQPDLVPSDLNITGSASSGRPLEVNYTISNGGFADKAESQVMNYFYISRNDTLNADESTLIGFESFTDPLEMEASVSNTTSLNLPFDEFGDYFLYLETDGEDNICEVQGEENNVISIPLEINLSTQPDLVPEFPAIPDTLYAGSSYNFEYTVSNEGAADAIQDSWYDRIMLGFKRIYRREYTEVLPAMDFYTQNVNFTIDLETPEGNTLISLQTDFYDNLFEFGGENNNQVTKEVFIERDESRVPDLSLESLEIGNNDLTGGDVLMLNYTILNNSAATPRNGWNNRLRIFDVDGRIVWQKELKHFGNIPAGETYTGTHEVRLPYTLAGDYRFELEVNSRWTLVEYNRDNNSNETSANVIAYIPPDLQVGDVQYASCCNLYALQEDEITLDISNNGPGILENKKFTLKIWLAEDAAGSNAESLLAHRQEFTISSESNTSITIPVRFDAHLSGDYYTIVELDTEDEIYEGKEEANNRYVTGYTVFIDNDPIALYPTDISITSPVDPDFSQSLSIAYTVAKGTEKELSRTIEDHVIVSSDRKYDAEDYRFRELFPVYRNIPAATPSFEGTLRGYIPTYLNPGWYYIGVLTDARNNVLELDETNNVRFTADSFYLNFTVPLELDTPQTLSFYEGTVGGQEAFSLERPAGKGMIATVDFSEDQASTELYHRVGTMPTRATFDTRYSDPFLADQEVIVGVTDTATTDYMRVIANRVPWLDNSPIDFDCWTSYMAASGGNVMTFYDQTCELPDPVPYTITATGAEYSILRSVPDSASYLGSSNLLIQGFDFEEGMQFSMVNGAENIPARRVKIISSTEAVAVFDFREKPEGLYDIVAEKQGGETTVLEDYFTVFEGSPPSPWTSINHSVRTELINKKFYVNVDFGNYSYVNGYDYWLIFAIATESGSLEHLSSNYIGSSEEDIIAQLPSNPNPTGDSLYVDIDSIRYYAYWIPVLPPRSQTTFSYIMDSKEEDFILTMARLYQQPLSVFSFEQDIDYVGQSVTVAKMMDEIFDGTTSINSGLLDTDLKKATGYGTTGAKNNDLRCEDLNIQKVEMEIAHNVQSYAEYVHGGAQATAGARHLGDAVVKGIKSKKNAFKEDVEGALNVRENAQEAGKDFLKNKLDNMVRKDEGILENTKEHAKEFYNSVSPFEKLREAVQPEEVPFEKLLDKTFSCIDPGNVQKNFEKCYIKTYHRTLDKVTYAPVKSEGCNHPPGTFGNGGSNIVESKDPNAIIGPAGVTDAQLVTKNEELKYTILFENMPEASAPARFVAIDNDLPEGLSPQSFAVTSFGFGDTLVQVEPTNRLTYRMQLGKTYNYQELQLVAGIDIVNNRAFWRFSTINPETGNLTTDPLNGFLPPNDSTRIGEGFVTYRIKVDQQTPGGTEILNQAEIIFDQNEVIATNVWSNTVASPDPVSMVNELPETTEDSIFTITWEGHPGATSAGIGGYDIYVAKDEEPYTLLLENTVSSSTSFTGESGSMYSFYSVLRTLDGVIEAAPEVADAVTTILAVDDTTGSDTTEVSVDAFLNGLQEDELFTRIYPIPAEDVLFVVYASNHPVTLRLLDLNGRLLHEKVLQRSSDELQVQIDLSNNMEGVMILDMDNGHTRKWTRVVKY